MKNPSIPTQIIDQKITRIWRGYAGVIFLELGKLSKELLKSSKGDYFSQWGEFTIMIEGDWLLKKENKEILNVVESQYSEIDDILKEVVGLRLDSSEFNKSNNDFVFRIGKKYDLIISGQKNQQLTIFNKSKTIFKFGE